VTTADENPGWLPPEKHYQRLPKTIMSVSLLITDERGRVLMVKPAYKATADTAWEIVGGSVNEGEYPVDAARREGNEELGGGVGVTPGALLVIDFVPPADPRPMLVTTVFDSGVLTTEQARAISLPPKELSEWAFFTLEEVAEHTVDRLARRITAAVNARRTGRTLMLHHGYPQ
jgi:8-oxo-dGTP diphosphatase